MTELGLSSISDAFVNFCSSSVLPMTLAAEHIWRMSSCNLRKTRMRLPSNWSVSYMAVKTSSVKWNEVGIKREMRKGSERTLQMSENEAPRHHWTTASMSSTLNDCTYSSSTSGNFDSRETFAIRRAISCITRNGAASSSFNFVTCSLCNGRTTPHHISIDVH